MIDQQGTYITKDGLQKLHNEIVFLKNVKRREIADRIQQAKELGDLSENAEYVEAKNEQAFIEGRILEIEHLLRNATIIPEKTIGDIVSVGSTIVVKHDGARMEYCIVGSSEADPANGKISNESPLGKAFLGKRSGESIEVLTPGGTKRYTIQKVQ
jgi:transcription elongation factor GreA